MPLDLSSSASADIKFISRVIDSEAVYLLSGEDGVAGSVSNDEDEKTILLFWGDAEGAQRVQQNGFENFEIEQITLFDFLYRWLSGMSEDDVLVGVNWDQDLVGTEAEPFELAEAIGETIPASLASAYEAKLDEPEGDE